MILVNFSGASLHSRSIPVACSIGTTALTVSSIGNLPASSSIRKALIRKLPSADQPISSVKILFQLACYSPYTATAVPPNTASRSASLNPAKYSRSTWNQRPYCVATKQTGQSDPAINRPAPNASAATSR